MIRHAQDYAAKYPALARRSQVAPISQLDFSRVLLGYDQHKRPVYLGERPRLEHMHIIGSTGSGKTTLMASLAMRDFRRGVGGVLIDPHGSHPDSLFNVVLSQLHTDGFCQSGRVQILDTDLLGAIVLRYLFLLASRRRNRQPFFVYVDECHRFLTGDVASILAESRKFGLAVVLGHQFTAQLGRPGDPLFDAVLNSTEIKAVFRVKSPAEAQFLAELVTPLSLEQPLRASIRPTAIGQRRVQLASSSSAHNDSTSDGIAETDGEMQATTSMHSISDGVGTTTSTSSGEGSFDGNAESASMLLTPPAQLFGPNHPSATMVPMALSQSTGSTASSGSSQQSATAQSESHMLVETHGKAETSARSRAHTRSLARTHGTSQTSGQSEGFETIYADRASGFHSKQNELYFAGEKIRSLPVGQAFVSWRGKTHHITIPPPKRPP